MNWIDLDFYRTPKVRVLDLTQTFEDDRVTFFIGDIRKYDEVKRACEGVNTVFHIASLTEPWGEYEAFFQVNVIGTENVIKACLECGATKLIYTSTGSVVMDGNDIRVTIVMNDD